MQLTEGRIPMTEAESTAVDEILASSGDVMVSLTRRDPGETGPILVDIDGVVSEVAADG